MLFVDVDVNSIQAIETISIEHRFEFNVMYCDFGVFKRK